MTERRTQHSSDTDLTGADPAGLPSRSSEGPTTRRAAIKAIVAGGAIVGGVSALGGGAAHAEGRRPSSSKKELSGKTAFITGGARGIGLATAQEMARAGANIVIFDIASKQVPGVGYPLATEADLKSAKRSVEMLGGQCLAFKGDVRDRAAQEQAMAQAMSKFGSLDIVVVNAGVTQAGSIEEFSHQELDAVIGINVLGAVKSTQAAAPILKKQRSGRIIYVSSALGRMGNELFPVYAASKWAVVGLAKSAALDFAKYNVMCNVVCPALVNTKLVDNEYTLRKMSPQDPTMRGAGAMLARNNPIPVGYYEPSDIARAIMFFAGDATSKVTGEVFDISLGTAAKGIG